MRKWGIGVDVVEVERFRRIASTQFCKRFFTPREIEYCLSYKKPAQHFAANFAGKEAVYKAVNGFCEIKLSQIEIIRDKEGAPIVKINSRGELPIEVKVSLSHSGSYAAAFAVADRSGTTRKIP